MSDKSPTVEVKPAAPESAPVTPPAPRRGPGHRGADVRDTVAEMAAKAQEISQEAGSKVAAAMKDVINAAAGIAGFAVESARDLVQYMVRRGQMTQEEADKLMREAEDAHVRRGGHATPPPASKRIEPEVRRAEPVARTVATPLPPKVAAPAATVRTQKPAAKAPAARKASSSKTARPSAKSGPKAKQSRRASPKKSPAKKK